MGWSSVKHTVRDSLSTALTEHGFANGVLLLTQPWKLGTVIPVFQVSLWGVRNVSGVTQVPSERAVGLTPYASLRAAD